MSRLHAVMALAVFLTLSAGCAGNPYKNFYFDQTAGIDARSDPRIEPPPARLEVYQHSGDVEKDVRGMRENGYTLIGYSSFNAGPTSPDLAIRHGQEVGAHVVLVSGKYTHTVSGSIPYTVQNPDHVVTSDTSGTVNAYGSDGYAHGSYSGTTTTTVPGGYTTHQIPYSVHRSDYLATFWVKRKPMILGVYYDDLTPELRRALGRNRGVVIATVVKNSPAFNADILIGDVLLAIDGTEITGIEDLTDELEARAGQWTELTVVRGGEQRVMGLQLNPRSE